MEIPKIPNARYIDVTKFFLISRPPAQEQNPLTLVAPSPGDVMAILANCGVIYGGRYVWWQVARLVALIMTVLAGAMPGWSYDSVTGTRVGLYHTCMRAICTTTFDGMLERGSSFSSPFIRFFGGRHITGMGNRCYLVPCGIPGMENPFLSCTVWYSGNGEIVAILY